MSCNGCRVLRKGCNENCILRQSLQGIDHSPQAQANATVFVAKFFGRAGLMSFLSAVPESQRPALFQSLLFEACGRTVNPVNGAVGLLWTGNWHVCQAAVETVLRGGELSSSPELFAGAPAPGCDVIDLFRSSSQDLNGLERCNFDHDVARAQSSDLNLSLTSNLPAAMFSGGRMKRRPPSEESETTTFGSGLVCNNQSLQGERKLLRLFI
ncbi:LOB domain-containing protein 37-like [Apium graveolens]|uniref:LOB domain-containing protein 37-like n=1 Tax=Apium graveolens TaxID=4045 RepID=UPI003D7AF5B1